MAYSILEGRFHYPNGDHFDFEGVLSDQQNGGSFLAGEKIYMTDPRGFKYFAESGINLTGMSDKSYVEIKTVENLPGSHNEDPPIEVATGKIGPYLSTTRYYDSSSGLTVSLEDDGMDVNFMVLDGEFYFDGIVYKFDTGTSIDLPGSPSGGNPDPEENGFIKFEPGKGKLKGSAGADEFWYTETDTFGKKGADKITNFNAEEGDYISFESQALPGFPTNEEMFYFESVGSKKELKKASKEGYEFVYFEKKGRLYYDGNGAEKNWGSSSEGGLIAILQGKPELTVDNIEVYL